MPKTRSGLETGEEETQEIQNAQHGDLSSNNSVNSEEHNEDVSDNQSIISEQEVENDIEMELTEDRTLIITRIKTSLQHAYRENAQEYAKELIDEITELKERLLKNENELKQLIRSQPKKNMLHENYQMCMKVLEAKGKLRKMEEHSLTRGSSPSSNNSAQPSTVVKLPKIEFPKFNGDIKNWVSFSTTFKDAIESSNLTETQKFLYLTSSLEGPAQNSIKHLACSGSNFDEAWDLLVAKYENPKELSVHLAQSILHQPIAETPEQIDSLIDTVRQTVSGAASIGYTERIPDWFLYAILIEKFSARILEDWERAPENDPVQVPKKETFLKFLQRQSKLQRSAKTQFAPMQSSTNSLNNVGKTNRNSSAGQSGQRGTFSKCPECSLDHALFKCPVMIKATVPDRWLIVKKFKLCYNCFSPKHSTSECQKPKCRECKKSHNGLLHVEAGSVSATNGAVVTNATVSKAASILSTAVVRVQHEGKSVDCRMLLDSGSTVSYLHSSVLNKLNLSCHTEATSVSTVTGMFDVNQRVTSANIESRNTSYRNTIEFRVTDTTQIVPVEKVMLDRTEFNQLCLADPNFDAPGPIDGILGSPVFSEVIAGTSMTHQQVAGITAIPTKLGWVLMGSAPTASFTRSKKQISCAAVECSLNRFWELEEIPAKEIISTEQQKTEDVFKSTTIILENGRFQVKMALRHEPPDVGKSRDCAKARLRSLLRKMEMNKTFGQLYRDNIQDYIDREHLVRVPARELLLPSVYLPHHGVLSESKTTKLRIVFDASATTDNGRSLNGETLDAPKTQDDLVSILIRFRSHKVAITGDISQMYRQIQLDPSQWDLQRILWRSTVDDPIIEYRLTTVTWGTKAAPYLATKVLNAIAERYEKEQPFTSKKIRQDFYVDDFLSGCQTRDIAIELQKNVTDLLGRHGFSMHKWASNDPAVLAAIPESSRAPSIQLIKDNEEQRAKTLGIQWNVTNDTFLFKFAMDPLTKITKRNILAATNSIFDPLGLLAPVLLRPKLLMQEIWKDRSIEWDAQLPTPIVQQWNLIYEDLPNITQLSVNRCVFPTSESDPVLCGFSDASERAYSAVLYARTIENGQVKVNIIAAKTKVAPLQLTTIPRLELLGALLLAKLVACVLEAIHRQLPVIAWTDSMVALGWIKAHPSRWKQWVGNRVQSIQQIIPPSAWRHIQGEHNPADCASRGISAKELVNHPLWLSGPELLYSHNFESCATSIPEPVEEMNIQTSTVTAISVPHFSNISSSTRVVRVNGYVLRFINNCRSKNNPAVQRRTGFLIRDEISAAEAVTWRDLQREGFPAEYEALANRKPIHGSSKLRCLNPIIDEAGIIRVGGRLSRSNLSYDQKHPIILPSHHPMTKSLVRELHNEHFHPGIQLLTAVIRNKFWLPNAKKIIKGIVHKCVRCTRMKADTCQQMMADLPAKRVQMARPFTNTGVDFAGPVTLRNRIARGGKTYKAWISVFVCMATRAIHIELVSGLDAESFLAAFQRFASRRGLPNTMQSDCGTNFSKANKELIAAFRDNPDIHGPLAQKCIEWSFHPPGAPHFSGLWEAGVKSIKFHLQRVVGDANLTFEEMSTVLTKIEACLNSRPLAPMTSDPEDFDALTPAHFLIGSPLHTVPEHEIPNKISHIKRWTLTKKIVQHFWRRWSGEYLSRLQHRPKWVSPKPNIQVNQLVLIKDENASPLHWRLGRVTAVTPGADGLVRVATVKTQHRTFDRPVVKLVPLPLDSTEESDE